MTATARSPRRRSPQERVRVRPLSALPDSKGRHEVMATSLGIVAALVGLVFVAILMNTQAALFSYDVHSLTGELTQLQQDNAQLRTEIDEVSSPERLAQVAARRGMVRAGETGYVTLADGTVVAGTPGEAAPQPAGDGDLAEAGDAVPEEAADGGDARADAEADAPADGQSEATE